MTVMYTDRPIRTTSSQEALGQGRGKFLPHSQRPVGQLGRLHISSSLDVFDSETSDATLLSPLPFAVGSLMD